MDTDSHICANFLLFMAIWPLKKKEVILNPDCNIGLIKKTQILNWQMIEKKSKFGQVTPLHGVPICCLNFATERKNKVSRIQHRSPTFMGRKYVHILSAG